MNDNLNGWGGESGHLPESWNKAEGSKSPELWANRSAASGAWTDLSSNPEQWSNHNTDADYQQGNGQSAPAGQTFPESSGAGNQAELNPISEPLFSDEYVNQRKASESDASPLSETDAILSADKPVAVESSFIKTQITWKQNSENPYQLTGGSENEELPQTLRDPYVNEPKTASKSPVVFGLWFATIVVGIATLMNWILNMAERNRDDSSAVVLWNQTESSADETASTESEKTTTVSESTTTTSIQTDAETTTTTVTEAASPKPTISNAYLYFKNTGAGINMYLHVSGEYSKCSYTTYYSLYGKEPYSLSSSGEVSSEDTMIESGLGLADSFKAQITVWNADQTESVEQWVYSKSTAKITKAKIIGLYNEMGGGYMYRLDVTGNYDYWEAEVKEKDDCGDVDVHTEYSYNLFNGAYISGGSTIEELSAVITPYDDVGLHGDKYTVKFTGDEELERVEEANPYLFTGYVATQKSDLILRKYPTTDSKTLAKIPKGTELDLYQSGITNDWYMTYYKGKWGYVSAEYIGIPGHSDW